MNDLEACVTFVYVHRLTSDALLAEATRLMGVADTVEGGGEREEAERLATESHERAVRHRAVALLQEGDLGQHCYCRWAV